MAELRPRLAALAAASLVGGVLTLSVLGAWQSRAAAEPALPAGSIGFIDEPVAEALVGSKVRITGWALDPLGVRGVEVRIDGKPYAAHYGDARPDVAKVKPGYPDSNRSGFSFDREFASLDAERHELAVVAINRAGAETILARKGLIPLAAMTQWQPLYAARRRSTGPPPFYVLPALSGIELGGAAELDTAYAPYVSATVGVGMRVPILYLRTTRGAARDWAFDPNWNIERRCGERRIAEDSLSNVLAFAILHKLPVLLTLNGGIWADAACDVPDWDVNDHLEQDKANCQWNQRDEVMPDDYFQRRPGAASTAELGRSLTFNVYAAQNRHYKRRNLQAAGRIVAAFAREHPDLFVGVNLDPDSYLNPFFEEQQWYDYNPGTLRQFRQWLAGSGPYAGKPESGVPDLSRYRRAHPLSLAATGALAGKKFRSWQEVDPPRAFPREGKPFWNDPWTHEWELFRRHLVALHYDELSQWLADAGIPRMRIFSSQGFVAPHDGAMPFAVRLLSPTKNYDSGGMSVEGSIPRAGHLGAILYGASAVNDVRVEDGANLFATFHRMDPGWATVEFNTADFRAPKALPTYAMGYRALREMFNYGARFASPMAWNGSNGIYAGQPDYVSFTAWRNTPMEDAMRDFAVSHAFVPLGARLWTFGSSRLADTDGWTAEAGRLVAGNGYVDVTSSNGELSLVSPPALALGRHEADLLVLGQDAKDIESVAIEARGPGGKWIVVAPRRAGQELKATTAGISVPWAWPSDLAYVDQIRVLVRFREARGTARIRHIALYPRTS